MDARSQRTKQVITDCFLELLSEKPVSKITVTEICMLSGINRSTFYKHYLDVPDLQETLEKEVLSDFETFLQNSAYTGNARYQTMLIQTLTYMKKYRTRFYLLCSANAASELPAKTFQLISDLAFPRMREKIPAVDEHRAKLLYQFLTHGCGALLVNWLRDDSIMTVAEAADFIMQISDATIQTVVHSFGKSL